MKETQGWELEIEGDDNNTEIVKSLDMKEEKKFLGVWDGPAAGSKGQLKKISGKYGTWTTRMKNGHLPPHMGWMAYKYKLWMSMRYGIGTMTNDVEESKHLLGKWDYATLNILGFASTIKKDGENYCQPLEEWEFLTSTMSSS